jgi:hypothetical protein
MPAAHCSTSVWSCNSHGNNPVVLPTDESLCRRSSKTFGRPIAKCFPAPPFFWHLVSRPHIWTADWPNRHCMHSKYQVESESISSFRMWNVWKRNFGVICFLQGDTKVEGQFEVRKSMHHHTIQINQPTRCNSFTGLLLVVFVWLSMFRAPLRPSSGAYNCRSRVNPPDHDQTTLQPPLSNGKTRDS